MSDISANNKRIAKNTIVLYLRTVLVLLVTLYSSRVILNGLGVVDYGIYNVVGGFITMFSVLSSSLSAAISRFITYELGRGDKKRLNMLFCTSLKTQIYLSIIVLVLAETIGLWFLNMKMVFPESRISAANWVFHLSLISFIINLLGIPYLSCIIAHEHIKAFAWFSILKSVLDLIVAFLIAISPGDQLVFYAIMIVVVSLIIRLLYGFYCAKNFEECHFVWKTDKSLTKEITGFAGWNFIGAASGILRDYGINVVLNLFFGPTVNAARGIAMQVSSAMHAFSGNFTTALNPQITKNYAVGNYDYTMKLVFQGARLSVYLLLFMSMPVLIETQFILQLWLEIVPEHTVLFVQLILLYILVEGISYTMITLMLATGEIKKYQIVVGGCQMLNLPLAYILMHMGYPPEITFISSISIALMCLFLRLYMLRGMVNLPVRRFLRSVLLNVIMVAVCSSVLPLMIRQTMDEGMLRFFVSGSVCVLSTGLVIFYVGCSVKERAFVMSKIKQYIHKKK